MKNNFAVSHTLCVDLSFPVPPMPSNWASDDVSHTHDGLKIVSEARIREHENWDNERCKFI
jgi:hypothetical protein